MGLPTAEEITVERQGSKRGDTLGALTIIVDFVTGRITCRPVLEWQEILAIQPSFSLFYALVFPFALFSFLFPYLWKSQILA